MKKKIMEIRLSVHLFFQEIFFPNRKQKENKRNWNDV